MSWSYSGNPADSNLDAVRFLLGDTDTTDQQLSNEEINYLLTQEGTVYKAASAGAKALIAKYARLVDKAVGDLRLSYSQRLAAYKELAANLSTQASFRSAMPSAGGISIADKELTEQDLDRVRPAFFRRQFDSPGVNAGGSDNFPATE